MKGLIDYITQAAWSDILTVKYVLVDDSYQQIDPALWPNRKFAPQGMPEFSDSEVIIIALFAETIFHGDEDKTLHFIRQYHLDMFPNLLNNSRFNRRRHQLAQVTEAIREHLRDRWRSPSIRGRGSTFAFGRQCPCLNLHLHSRQPLPHDSA